MNLSKKKNDLIKTPATSNPITVRCPSDEINKPSFPPHFNTANGPAPWPGPGQIPSKIAVTPFDFRTKGVVHERRMCLQNYVICEHSKKKPASQHRYKRDILHVLFFCTWSRAVYPAAVNPSPWPTWHPSLKQVSPVSLQEFQKLIHFRATLHRPLPPAIGSRGPPEGTLTAGDYKFWPAGPVSRSFRNLTERRLATLACQQWWAAFN